MTLLGQTVDSYRDPSLPPPVSDDPDESQFPHLLRAIARDVPGLARLRYTSPHPRHATLRSPPRTRSSVSSPRHVHLPVQSGSDRMLKRMIRRYTRAEYVARAERLRAARAGMTLSTDVIVGFSGETDDDFELTLSLVREVGFTSLFGFKYSPRPLTPALKLPDDVPEATKSERLARLFELAEGQTRAHLATLVGTRQQVLVEGASKSGGRAWKGGRSETRSSTWRHRRRSDADRGGSSRSRSRARTSTRSKGRSRRRPSPRSPARAGRAAGLPGAPATPQPAGPHAPRRARRRTPRSALANERERMPLYEHKGVRPTLGRDVFIAPNATVIGDVHLGDEASVWFGAVVRGDVFPIRFGARTNVQDGSVVHVTGGQAATTVGDDVTIGHMVLLHGCTVGNRCLIGMGSILLDGAEIGEERLIGAGVAHRAADEDPAAVDGDGAAGEGRTPAVGEGSRDGARSGGALRRVREDVPVGRGEADRVSEPAPPLRTSARRPILLREPLPRDREVEVRVLAAVRLAPGADGEEHRVRVRAVLEAVPVRDPRLEAGRVARAHRLFARVRDEDQLPFEYVHELVLSECQWRWLDQVPGGMRTRFTPNCVNPAASPSRWNARALHGSS